VSQNVLRALVEAFSYACRHSGIGPMLLLFVSSTELVEVVCIDCTAASLE
jgi:hypothetical protein